MFTKKIVLEEIKRVCCAIFLNIQGKSETWKNCCSRERERETVILIKVIHLRTKGQILGKTEPQISIHAVSGGLHLKMRRGNS